MKRLLQTFLVTVDAMMFSATLFFKVIIGTFGLAATSIGSLQQLKAVSQVLEQVYRDAEKMIVCSGKYS
jgi:hypothetical protein